MSNSKLSAQGLWGFPFAFSLSLLLMISFAQILGLQHLMRQWDFLLLWAVLSFLLTLPMVYLEIGLAKRGKMSVMQGLMTLTRDADARPTWRLVGWAGTLFMSLLTGGLLYSFGLSLGEYLDMKLPTFMLAGIMLASVVLSLLPRAILVLLLLVGVVASAFLDYTDVAPTNIWQWTSSTGQEWAVAVVLSLFTAGFGMSLYWQDLVAETQQQSSSTALAMRVWLALILAGVIYAILPMNLAFGNLALSALLLQFIRIQFTGYQLNKIVVWVLSVVFMLVWLITDVSTVLYPVLVIVGLVLCLVYSIFAGWVMKASHLRKALNFSSEMIYNLWRVAVRIIIPVSIIIAIVFNVQGWLA